MNLLNAIKKVAADHPETRVDLVPLIRKFSMLFDTQEALDKYMREHPDADRSNHKVVESHPEKTVPTHKRDRAPVTDEEMSSYMRSASKAEK